MSVGDYIRGLNIFDLLGVLIPGTVVLTVSLVVYSDPPFPGNVGQYALFALSAYIIGSVIQSVASSFVGDRKHFDRTISDAEVRSESELANTNESDQEGKSSNEGDAWCWRIFHPVIPPLGWGRPPRGEKLDDAILSNRVYEHLIDTHELPFRTEKYSVFYHLMLSRIDDMRSPSRAIRMQAIRNFNRGMWIASWYTSVVLFVAMIIDYRFDTGEKIPVIHHTYDQPFFFELWIPVLMLFFMSIGAVFLFWWQSESSEEDYLEYLFADYSVAAGTGEKEISREEILDHGNTGDPTNDNEESTSDTQEDESKKRILSVEIRRDSK